jgi:low molecular weight protein-tyrosine phosphatase
VSEPLRVVFVCTGNRFRSPLAAAVLRRELGDALPADVFSVGTLRVHGAPALAEAVELAPHFGIDLSAHRARQLEVGALAGVDVAVGFEKFHVAAAVVDGGVPRANAFTLPELVEVLERVDRDAAQPSVERARARLAAAAGVRGPIGRPPEIPDPFGLSAERQREVADEVVRGTTRLAALLAG